jgi:hypothetical protein
MRLTSEFYTSALLRRVFGAGGFGAVVKRGATEAGSIFVLSRKGFGTVSLYGPAAQASYDSARPDDRLFTLLAEDAPEDEVLRRLEREQKFDPDIWIVEIEPAAQPIEDLLRISPP